MFKKLIWFLTALMIRDEVREKIGKIRYIVFKNRMTIFSSSNIPCLKNTISHNLSAFLNIETDFNMRRMKWLIFATLSIESVTPQSRFLLIGPRTENELLLLKALGYNNLVGLDLISYSPWVKLGDMHAMPFEKDSFDVVISGWTLSYSKNPKLFAKEICRVLKNGGILSIGVEKVNLNFPILETEKNLIDPNEARENRINSIEDIEELFNDLGSLKSIVNYDALLSEHKNDELKKITGLASSQVVFSGKLLKH